MKIAIISFTGRGTARNSILKNALQERGYQVEARAVSRFADGRQVMPLEGSVIAWSGKTFKTADSIIFIGAAGIAVRCIAPFVDSKTGDPAVLVMDEEAAYVVPILSGHLGGANEMAGIVAGIMGSQPVITTATDVQKVYAVDLFAKEYDMAIRNPEQIKRISAALLEGQKIAVYSEFPVTGTLPEGLYLTDDGMQADIVISIKKEPRCSRKAIHLIPRIIYAGIGCRRDTEQECIERHFLRMMEQEGLAVEAVAEVASIEDKKEEKGLLAFTRAYGWNFTCYTAQELQEMPGTFTASAFVKKTVGVDNVCERSARRAAGGGPLLCGKQAGDGVTAALAVKEWSVSFE